MVNLNGWTDPYTDNLPKEEGPVQCYFADTGNQIVCYFKPTVLVRPACFMLNGEEVEPTYWRYLFPPPQGG